MNVKQSALRPSVFISNGNRIKVDKNHYASILVIVIEIHKYGIQIQELMVLIYTMDIVHIFQQVQNLIHAIKRPQ
jgi:hypothetical protein